ncbi:ATP-binding protein [Paenibacillus sp. WQ 127069]|uniref:histidine kinase n=2 Tax=Paenibacillus baimaensis TaxID=2982185 RepID=A0ABT2UAH0_9BACL|nr:ATP-binding protein [Paenibacillus sp. WQ 127069]
MSKWNYMKFFLMIGVICTLLVGFRMLWIVIQTIPEHPKAVQGVLDLRNFSINNSRPITLDGQWEFYPGQWLQTNDTASLAATTNRDYLNVPGKWDDAFSSTAQENAAHGYGTYRLVVKIPESEETMFGIRVMKAVSASEVYINGHLTAQNGRPAVSKELHQARNTPYSAFFTSNGSTIEIIIHMSNYEYARGGGIVRSVKLGTAEAIGRESLLYTVTNLTAAIVLFLYGFCAFILYAFRNRSRMFLYFSFLLFSGASTVLMNYEKLFLIGVPLNFEWAMKLQYLAYCGTAMFVLLFLKHLLPEYGKARSIPWFCTLCGLVALVSVLSPASYVALIEPLPVLLNATTAIIVPVFYLREAWKRGEGAFYMLLGACGTFSHTVWSVMDNMALFEAAYYPFDLLISFFSLALFWSVKFLRATENTKKLAEELLQADRNKDEFLSVTSHELRNPLHGMINIAQAVIDTAKPALDHKQTKDLELLISIGRRMSFLLNDLLDLDRLKANAIRLETSRVRVQSVASVVLDMLHFMIEDKSLQLVHAIPDDFPEVRADENRLLQILFNLLHNAVKYTHEGSISISAELKEGMAYIHIHDTGSGIDVELQSRIFEPYERGDANLTGTEGGLGLGLSISSRLIQLHKGSLTVSSEQGRGSIFTFTLPLADVIDPTAIMMVQSVAAAASFKEIAAAAVANTYNETSLSSAHSLTNSPRILIVDDDTINLKILYNLLKAELYEIVTVTGGHEALAMLNKDHWDLVITDVMMPYMSGYELTRSIRNRFSLSELPVLLLTARNRPEDVSMGFQSGANDFITKPMDALELKFRVRTLTDLNRSFRERLSLEAAWLHAQIKPHFLFNALNSIAALSEFDMERMRSLLEAFTQYLRASFDFRNLDQLIHLEQELDHVRTYLFIEKERFEDRLEVVWELNGKQHLMVPPLSIQPLVENAIRHGIMNRIQGGIVTIRVTQRLDGTEITVSDNGVGMTDERLQAVLNRTSDERQGVGLYNLDRRLKQSFGEGLNIESEAGLGTTVKMSIPLQ